MRIDYEYMGKILNTFLESPLPTANWNDFESLRNDDDHKFIFHIEIMHDKGLIISTLKSGSLGINRDSNDYAIAIVDWRLTADGHDFASALTKPTILHQIKSNFQKEGLSAVIDITKKIAIKQLEKYIAE